MTFDLNAISESLGIDKLQEQAEKDSTQKKDYSDDRFWKPTRDDAGNAYARIRFMPPPQGEPTPWVTYYDHAFKGPTGLWYFAKSLKTLDQTCPVQEYQNLPGVWPSDNDPQAEAKKRAYRSRKPRVNYIYNVYVIEDKNNPKAEGKVWLYRCGATIYDKIQAALNPKYDDEKPVPVFDFLNGADFKMKVFTKDDFPKYDDSGFDAPSQFMDGDAQKIEPIYNSLHSLQAFIAPDQFESYDVLKAKLYRVLALNINGEPVATPQQQAVGHQETGVTTPSQAAAQPAATQPAATTEKTPTPAGDSSDGMAYFKDLAASDDSANAA